MIARSGETEYASIYRKRSGHDSGTIDYGIAVAAVERLADQERRELVKVAKQLVESLEQYVS